MAGLLNLLFANRIVASFGGAGHCVPGTDFIAIAIFSFMGNAG
jgi:hypothetical protein